MHEQPPPITADVLNDQFEQEQQAGLFELNADLIVEYGGYRGTLRELLNKCPVPAEQRSYEATEQFTANIMVRNGFELPPRFEHLRGDNKSSQPEKAESKQSEIKKVETKPAPAAKSVASVETVESVQKPQAHEAAIVVAPKLEPVLALKPVVQDVLAVVDQVKASVEHIEHVLMSDPEQKTDSLEQLPIQERVVEQYVESVPQAVLPVRVEAMAEAIEDIPERTEEVASAHFSLSDVLPPETPQPTLAEQLAVLYEEAIVEAEMGQEAPIEYESELVDIDQVIAEILDIPVEELQTAEAEVTALPTPLSESILNTLSIDETQPDLSMDAEVEPVESIVLPALPAHVNTVYQQHLEQAPVEEAEQVQALVETITLIADRLQVLISEDRSEEPEVAQIEAVLEEYYDELCSQLGLPVEDEERRKFIAALRTLPEPDVFENEFEEPQDEGTHEFKHALMSSTHQLPVLLQQTAKLARYMMTLNFGQPVA